MSLTTKFKTQDQAKSVSRPPTLVSTCPPPLPLKKKVETKVEEKKYKMVGKLMWLVGNGPIFLLDITRKGMA